MGVSEALQGRSGRGRPAVGDLSNLRNIFQFRDSFQLSILGNLSSLANIFNSKIQIKLSIVRDLLFVYIDRGGGLQFLHFSLGDSYSKSA